MSKDYLPVYWLSSLGFGGLMITFFLLLQFNVPHPQSPIPLANDISKFLDMEDAQLEKVAIGMLTKKASKKIKKQLHLEVLSKEKRLEIKQQVSKNTNKIEKIVSNLRVQQIVTYVGLIGVVFSILMFFKLLFWNIIKYAKYTKTDSYKNIKNSLAEVKLMAVPLTLAMGVKVILLGGALFIDGWFTATIGWIAFGSYILVGAYAMYLFSNYFSNILDKGNEDFVNNNSLEQMLSIFTFSFISVGLIGPAAFFSDPVLAKWSFVVALSFGTIALFIAYIKFSNSIAPILIKGLTASSSVSLLILIPILTLFGVWGVLRMDHALHHAFHSGLGSTLVFVMLTAIFALQSVIFLIGIKSMRNKRYFSKFIYGKNEHDPAAYAIICPLVAFYVWGMFWLHAGLVKSGFLDKWGIAYVILFASFSVIQVFTVFLYMKLNKKLLGSFLSLKRINLKPVRLDTI